MNPRRRHDRNRKIKRRKKIIKQYASDWWLEYSKDDPQLRDGYYENNNMINKYSPPHLKTKSKRDCYKHKGRYGCKAKNYKHHDLVEITRMDVEEAEFNGTNIHKRVK